MESEDSTRSLNFIEQRLRQHCSRQTRRQVHTRFPRNPTATCTWSRQAICVSFGLAQKYGGKTNLRFDDTNPEKESVEYVNAIREDIAWLGLNGTAGSSTPAIISNSSSITPVT